MITARVTQNRFKEVAEALRRGVAERIAAQLRIAADAARARCPLTDKPHTDGTPHMRDTVVVTTDEGSGTSQLKVTDPKAAYVELGHHTAGGGWVAPEPFVSPAVDAFRRELPEHLRNIL